MNNEMAMLVDKEKWILFAMYLKATLSQKSVIRVQYLRQHWKSAELSGNQRKPAEISEAKKVSFE